MKLFAKFRKVEHEKAAGDRQAEAGVPGEVVAVIAAAVAVVCGKDARVIGIAPARRSFGNGRTPWSTAGLLENTRPF